MEPFNDPREEIEALLPWYEKGTLPPKEARRVEDYLRKHPELQHSLALIREDAAETIAANERIGMPSSAALDRLMADIAAAPRAARASRLGMMASLKGLFGGGNWMPVAAAAATVVILVQAATLGVLLTRSGPDGPGLASGGQTNGAGPGSYAWIRFNETARAAEVSAFLRSLNLVIVDGPKPGGAYRVRLSAQPLSAERREEILRQIRAKSDIIGNVADGG